MTRILEIVGTKVKVEIDRCGQCPVWMYDHLACRYVDHEGFIEDNDPPHRDCPLPEKKEGTHKPIVFEIPQFD